MPRPIRATFNLPALHANFALARARAGGARVWAVLKANAYGHGLLRIAHALEQTNGYAVLDLNDAIRLRESGIRQPILLLEGLFDPGDLPLIAEHSLSVVIHCEEQLQWLEMGGLPVQIPVYLKLNTGMNRLGFGLKQFSACYQRLRQCAGAGPITLMTHFADADGPAGVAEQMARFEKATAKLDLPRSLANSAALLRFPETHGDWVRPGIMLYGCSPFSDQSAAQLNLEPVMTLTSELIAVQNLRSGESTGYGDAFVADKATRIGIVACGYADGYPRHAPTGTPVLVGGKRTRTVGRVSMDMMAVDINDLPEAGVGTPVTLWGDRLAADEVAAAAGTVSYELLCALAARVPQVERS